MFFDFDIETYPLQIRTNSTAGSGDLLYVQFDDADGKDAGGVKISFEDPPQWALGYCMEAWKDFVLTQELIQTWTIKKVYGGGAVLISCNDEEVVNYLYAASNNSKCESKWSKEVSKIRFNPSDTASLEYRAKPLKAGEGGLTFEFFPR